MRGTLLLFNLLASAASSCMMHVCLLGLRMDYLTKQWQARALQHGNAWNARPAAAAGRSGQPNTEYHTCRHQLCEHARIDETKDDAAVLSANSWCRTYFQTPKSPYFLRTYVCLLGSCTISRPLQGALLSPYRGGK